MQTEPIDQQDENGGEITRLPLWRTLVETMLKEGVAYGQSYPVEYFEKGLRCARDCMQFGIGVHYIRRELERHGFYLSGRGQKGNQFVVLPPESNADVLCGYSRAATDALKRGVILGTQTRLDSLSDSERARHEKVLEILATKSVLIGRAKSVHRVIKKHEPKLLD